MSDSALLRLQLAVFALVSACFTNIYITQPVLPVLQQEFSASSVLVSFTVSAVVLGIALANLPFGVLADRLPIRPIIAVGTGAMLLGGLVCVLTNSLWLLIAGRFLQGLFVPALTTCIAAYLAKALPPARLNVVMGYYVSATVVGGMGGRLLGGWIHPPLHWRYAFVSAGVFLLVACAMALWSLPRRPLQHGPQVKTGFMALLRRRDLLALFACGAGGFALFSSTFNYLPFRLSEPQFGFSTEQITLVYLVYIMGIFMGPMAGRIANRVGNGTTLLAGTAVLALALGCLLLPAAWAIVLGLIMMCAGFFTVHAGAVGAINRKLSGGQGRANALYVLFYYVGGWAGITLSGLAYTHSGWNAVVGLSCLLLLILVNAGLSERRYARGASA
ncbi:MAG: MFS transporter [Pseudomonadota bacterium]|nr:MFS transporter [Pseudomonadota bacterium]